MDNQKEYSIVELLLKLIFLLTVRFSFAIVFLLTALYCKLAATEYINIEGNKIDGFGRTLYDSPSMGVWTGLEWSILDACIVIWGIIVSLVLFQGFKRWFESMVYNVMDVPWYERL